MHDVGNGPHVDMQQGVYVLRTLAQCFSQLHHFPSYIMNLLEIPGKFIQVWFYCKGINVH